MDSQLKPGDRVLWTSDTSGSEEAMVNAVRSDQEEGLSPESEDYVARWAEVTGISGSRTGKKFTFLLGVDGHTYLDGQQVDLRVVQHG